MGACFISGLKLRVQVLLVKARQVINKLQGEQDSAIKAETERAAHAEARCSDLTTQLQQAWADLEQARNEKELEHQVCGMVPVSVRKVIMDRSCSKSRKRHITRSLAPP